MNVESWAKEVRRLVRALDTRDAHTEAGAVTLEQRLHGATAPSKSKPAAPGVLRWRAQCAMAGADGATAEEAGAALLGKQLADSIAHHRDALARLESHQAPGLRLLAADRGEKPS